MGWHERRRQYLADVDRIESLEPVSAPRMVHVKPAVVKPVKPSKPRQITVVTPLIEIHHEKPPAPSERRLNLKSIRDESENDSFFEPSYEFFND